MVTILALPMIRPMRRSETLVSNHFWKLAEITLRTDEERPLLHIECIEQILQDVDIQLCHLAIEEFIDAKKDV